MSTGINHSLVVASDEYAEKYFTELPAFFNPEKYIYAYKTSVSYEDWKYGDRKSFVLEPIEGNSKTKINDLRYKSEQVDYKKDFDAKTYIAPIPIWLVISAVIGQRFYSNNEWLNAVVLKIENALFRKLNIPPGLQSNLDGAK